MKEVGNVFSHASRVGAAGYEVWNEYRLQLYRPRNFHIFRLAILKARLTIHVFTGIWEYPQSVIQLFTNYFIIVGLLSLWDYTHFFEEETLL